MNRENNQKEKKEKDGREEEKKLKIDYFFTVFIQRLLPDAKYHL